MKKIFLMVLIGFFIAIVISNYKNTPSVIIADLLKNGPVANGQLRYRLYLFGFLPIGEAVLEAPQFELYKKQKVYHLNAKAQSLDLFSAVFSGKAVLESYVDFYELNPIIFKQTIINGEQSFIKEAFYNQRKKIVTVDGVERQMLPDTQDPLSGILKMQKIDFDKVNSLEMNINTNQKNYILTGAVEQKEIVVNNTALKLVFIKAEVKRRDGNPYHKSKLDIVFLKNKENILVLGKVFASGLLINARLVEIK